MRTFSPDHADAVPLRRLAAVNTTRTNDVPRRRNRPRGLPPALADHEVARADDPSRAARACEQVLGRHVLHVDDELRDRFDATLHAVLLRDVTVGFLDLGVPTTIELLGPTGDHLVVVPSSGMSVVEVDGVRHELTPIHATVVPTDRPARLLAASATSYVLVKIEAGSLDRHLARLLGRTTDRTVEFDPVFDLAAPTSHRWNAGLQMILAELVEPNSLARTTTNVGQLEEFLMAALLFGHASNYSSFLGSSAQPRRAVRAARDFIDRNLTADLVVADIAAAAGVSVRTLQNHFADDIGQTPTAYLRSQRLDRVRADLADTPRGESTTVTDVALRWGFRHLGRFSIAYRDRFGESPSETLRS